MRPGLSTPWPIAASCRGWLQLHPISILVRGMISVFTTEDVRCASQLEHALVLQAASLPARSGTGSILVERKVFVYKVPLLATRPR